MPPHAYPHDLFRLLLLSIADVIPDVSNNVETIPERIDAVCARTAKSCGREFEHGTDLRDLVVAAFQMYEDHYIPYVIDGHVAELDDLDAAWRGRLPEGR